jgi:hypothetical protein
MNTSMNEKVYGKLTMILDKYWEESWSDPTQVFYLRLGVLADRDLKLELIRNFRCDDDIKFKELVLNTLQSYWGKFKIIVDESVDHNYCEFEFFKPLHKRERLHESEMVVNHENTLENFKGYKSERMCGNTTRLIDHAVQIIMSGKICHVLDHHEMGESVTANNKLASKIMYRLHNEFDHLQYEYDPFKNTISFKNIY